MDKELVDMFDAIGRTAGTAARGTMGLVEEAAQLGAREARQVLLEELRNAIDMSEEFSNNLLKERLVNYFADPERVIVSGSEILINVDDDAGNEWVDAQQAINEMRQVAGDSTKEMTQAQRAAYWKYKVYPTDDYDETIERRLGQLQSNEAPYWYFLEYGTGPMAHPSMPGTYFLTKTRYRIKGIIKYWIDKLAKTMEGEATKAIDVAVKTGGEVIVRWSRWYQGKSGKFYSHRYDARGRILPGKKRVREAL